MSKIANLSFFCLCMRHLNRLQTVILGARRRSQYKFNDDDNDVINILKVFRTGSIRLNWVLKLSLPLSCLLNYSSRCTYCRFVYSFVVLITVVRVKEKNGILTHLKTICGP